MAHTPTSKTATNAKTKTYAQFCGLARALDHVGDRWTLLIVRELLIGDAAFRDLEAALPGISPNLLVDRLRGLEADGLVERTPAPARSKAVRYRITDFGRTIEPAVIALIRWGAAFMAAGPGDDRADPRWAPLALRSLLASPNLTRPRGAVVVDVEGTEVTVRITPHGRTVEAGGTTRSRAVVAGPLPSVLGVAAGALAFPDAGLVVTGDADFAATALAPA